ncbi:hypothetical protein GCM10010405_23180 [Streptomyces macrosporus]|uniref:Uncharacterized protein n=1 Tax=Streptomyces macrosporus TaxID=44032 RepID=A0ABP5X107_9ACTN
MPNAAEPAVRPCRGGEGNLPNLRIEGHEVRDEDIAGLSPLKHRSLNMPGRYGFHHLRPVGGSLRSPRAPDAPELDEDDGGQDRPSEPTRAPSRLAAAIVPFRERAARCRCPRRLR